MDAAFHTAISLILVLILRENISLPQLSLPWLGISAWALTQATVVYLVIYGFKRLEAHLASLIMPLEVFFGAFFGFLFFQETLSTLTILGGLLILLGFSLPHIKMKRFPLSPF